MVEYSWLNKLFSWVITVLARLTSRVVKVTLALSKGNLLTNWCEASSTKLFQSLQNGSSEDSSLFLKQQGWSIKVAVPDAAGTDDIAVKAHRTRIPLARLQIWDFFFHWRCPRRLHAHKLSGYVRGSSDVCEVWRTCDLRGWTRTFEFFWSKDRQILCRLFKIHLPRISNIYFWLIMIDPIPPIIRW